MKHYFLAVLFCIVALTAKSQNGKADKAFSIYETNVVPYFKQMIEREEGPETTDESKRQVIFARTERLRSQAAYFDLQLKKDSAFRNITDNRILAKMISRTYKNNFPGLPKEFYTTAENAVAKL